MNQKHKANLFQRACRRVKIKGVSLHSYRYSWAERAKEAGYSERFAQIALGHDSKCGNVHKVLQSRTTQDWIRQKVTADSGVS